MRGIEDIALAFDASCRAAGVDYAFMGALAVMAWGEPRATQDVDTLLDIRRDAVERLRAELGRRGLQLDPRDVFDAFEDGSHVTITSDDSVFYVDAKIARTPLERQQVGEAADIPFRDGGLRVVRPEETIAFKLSFGSPKDIQDARSILVRVADTLDRQRLAAFALQLGVTEKLRDVEDEIAKGRR